MSSTESPLFSMIPKPDAPSFNDNGEFGFDPKLDFIQVLGEARKHRQHHPALAAASVRLKLPKPIAKDQEKKKKSPRNRKPRWSCSSWRGALDLLFFKLKWPVHVNEDCGRTDNLDPSRQLGHLVSVPLYLAESRNTLKTCHRVSLRSVPLATSVPYVCLSRNSRSTVALPPTTSPLYSVT